MASPASYLSILVIPLLVASLFYPVSNAIDATDIDRICNKTMEYDFCKSTFDSDNRTATADDLNDLLNVSISLNMNLIEDTIINRIPPILQILKDPLDKARLQNCSTDLYSALLDLTDAYLASASGNFQEAAVLASVASWKSAACANEYNSTKHPSPIADVPAKVGKLIVITYILAAELQK